MIWRVTLRHKRVYNGLYSADASRVKNKLGSCRWNSGCKGGKVDNVGGSGPFYSPLFLCTASWSPSASTAMLKWHHHQCRTAQLNLSPLGTCHRRQSAMSLFADSAGVKSSDGSMSLHTGANTRHANQHAWSQPIGTPETQLMDKVKRKPRMPLSQGADLTLNTLQSGTVPNNKPFAQQKSVLGSWTVVD